MNALTEILSHPFVHKLGWTLVHLLWQGAVVALLLAIVLRLLRKSSANVRYVVACSALAVVVILPVVTIQLVPAPPSYALLEAESASLPPPTAEAMKIVPVNLEAVEPFPAIGLKQRVVNLLEPTLPYIVAGWVLGVFTLSLWHLGGWTHLQRLRRRLTKQADASLLAKLGALVEKLRITRPVRLLESALVQIPTVVGCLRPVILLPATALTGLTSEQIEALLAHELAHVRRGDYLINMLQTVVEILGFYHPAVWWISNKIRLERENCCDDIAVAICGDKMNYATALAEMERIRSARSELALAANGGNLLARIRRLIGGSPAPKQRFNWAAALITALVIAALAIPTTLALSRKYSSDAPPQPIVLATSETTDDLPALPGASVVDEAQGLAQITFDCKIFQLYADLPALEPEPGEKTQDGLYVRIGNNYAQTLERLAEQNRYVKVLASPTLRALDGKLGIIKSEAKMEYVKGYEEKPGNKSEPIKDTVPATMELKIQGKVAADNQVRTQLSFFESTPNFETQNDAQGREVQIPQIAKIECSTVVISPDRQPFIVGGLKSTGDPQHKVMLMITPTVTPARDSAEAATERTVELDKALPLAPAPITGETEDKAQIVFEMKYFALPANSKLIKDAGKDGTFVRTDKAFAEQLLELSKESKDAKVLAAPRVTVIAGEEAMFTISDDMHYTSGYTEQPDGEPKPIIKTVQRGTYAKIKGDLVGDNAIFVRLLFTQTIPTLTTHKVAKGREIQIPIVRTTECATAVTVANNGVVIIGGLGGLQSSEKPDQTLIVQMVSRIVRKDDTDSPAGPLPIADSSEEVSFTVAPQVITSVRVDTEGIPAAFSDSRNGPAKAVEEFIAILKGQALPSFELLDSKMAVAGQLDDLRKVVSEQSVEIDSATSDDKQALIATKSLKDDHGREGRLVFHLTRKDGKWTIDDIDFEDPEGLANEIKRFNERMHRPGEPAAAGPSAPPAAGAIEAVADSGNEPVKAVEEFIAMLKGQALPSFELLDSKMAVAGQLDDLRKVVSEQSVEIDSATCDDKQALIATKSLKDDRGREGRLVFHLARKDGKWTIDDIDFEDPEGLEDEIKRFNELMHRPGTPFAAGQDAPVAAGTIEAADFANMPEGIVGSAFNLQAIGQPLRGPDTPQSGQIITIFKLQYANCELLADTLMNLLEPDEKGPVVKIVPDESSNSLIIQANSAEREKIEDLIAHLDRAERSPAGDNKAEDSEEFRSLQSQRKQIADKAKELRRKILQLQQDIGAADLKTRYDVGVQRVVALMSELGTLESGRISLEARVKSLENAGEDTMDPTETFRMRHDYVNNDATVKALADKLAQVEMELILARQNNSQDSPEVKKQVGLIEALKKRLDETKEELGIKFDELIAAQAAETHKQQLDAALSELDQIRSQEDHRRKELAEQDARVVQFGQKQLEIQMIQSEIDTMQQEHDEVSRRITDLRTQLEKPPVPTLFEISESARE